MKLITLALFCAFLLPQGSCKSNHRKSLPALNHRQPTSQAETKRELKKAIDQLEKLPNPHVTPTPYFNQQVTRKQ